ncbi:MAG: hypothetical protein J6P44_02315 [Bacteroidales bacterium]|nr:hypothetical protein [Bacteroidales bacterium]
METPKFKPGDIVVTKHGIDIYDISTVLCVHISKEYGIEYSLSNNKLLPEYRLKPFEKGEENDNR